MDGWINVLRAVHIGSGVLALATFAIPLAVQKGNTLHRQAGWLYVIGMYVAAATAVALAPLRVAERGWEGGRGAIFLAYIGLMSFASAFYGMRVLKQKQRKAAQPMSAELAVPVLLMVAAVAMAVFSAMQDFTLGLAFAGLGLLVAVPQWRTLRRPPDGKTWWLVEHLGSMIIACIGTVTAFLVNNANTVFHSGSSVLVWLAPTLVGVPLLSYWKRKYRRS